MTAIEIIFVVVLAAGFYLGYTRGIIRTVLAIISYLIGLLAAFKFAPDITRLLERSFGEQPLMIVAGFILTFALAWLVIRLISKGLEGILKTANINIVNQVAGGVLVASLFVLFYSLLLQFGDRSTIIGDDLKRESRLYPILMEYPELAWGVGQRIKPIVVDFWDYTVDFMDRMQEANQVERTESENAFYEPPED